MNKNIKKYFIVFLVSLLLSLICAPLRAYDFRIAAIVESIVYAFATFFILSKYSTKPKEVISLVSVIILGRILLESPIRVINPEGTLYSLMESIIVLLGIILTGIIYYTRKVYILLLSLTVWGYCAFVGHDNWLIYCSTDPVSQLKTISYNVQTLTNEIKLDTLQNKYIVLDFWSSTCGVCLKQLPDYQKFYNKYKDKLLVRSVFVRYKDESVADGMQIITERGCDFPIWSVDKDNQLLKDLSIERYPAVVIIKDGQTIYKGPLKGAERRINRAGI